MSKHVVIPSRQYIPSILEAPLQQNFKSSTTVYGISFVWSLFGPPRLFGSLWCGLLQLPSDFVVDVVLTAFTNTDPPSFSMHPPHRCITRTVGNQNYEQPKFKRYKDFCKLR